jgi:eukaryotic-like serine/threonine-protein kinase
MAELLPGTVIAERYRLERKIGEGGMGEVWAAVHALTRKSVALKVLKGEKAERSDVVHRFFREARAASAVRHPNVVQIHDMLVHDGAPVMVMDLLEGESLSDFQDRQPRFALPDLATLLVPVISAVAAAHARGIVHRDLKPENIFLSRRPDGILDPKVLDFGIAKLGAREGEAEQTAALTRTGSMLGTPYYMAPEQVFGQSDVDRRVDVWAIGIIIYECLAGRRPFRGENFGQVFRAITFDEAVPLEEVRPDLPEDVTRIVARMLVKSRDERCPDLSEPLAVLARHAGSSVSAALLELPTSGTFAASDADTVSASVMSSAATEETMLAPSSPATADGRTEMSPAAATEISPAPRKMRLLAAAGAIAAIAGIAIAVGSRPTAAPIEPSGTQPEPASASPSEPEIQVTPALPGAEATAEAARDAAAEAPAAKPVVRDKPVRPNAKPPASAAAPTTVQPKDTAPRKLPGGILDQEKPPF